MDWARKRQVAFQNPWRLSFWGSLVVGCLGLVVGVLVFTAIGPANAGVTQKTSERPYWVSGTTASQLVRYMRRHPTRGDRGAAWANIRPRFSLSLKTRGRKKCTVRAVNMHIDFLMTLPRGRQTKAMNRSTRRLWRSFTRFTRAHELAHRRIYMKCARKFSSAARKTPAAANCRQLTPRLRRQMFAAMRTCDKQHRAFDRREAKRLRRLPLLRAAK